MSKNTSSCIMIDLLRTHRLSLVLGKKKSLLLPFHCQAKGRAEGRTLCPGNGERGPH